MKKVLFVCLGNICRSPLAEGILRHKVNELGLDIEVDSAGTGHWHAGENPDRRAVKTGKGRGVDISKLVARQIKRSDFKEFDLILVADEEVKYGVLDLAEGAAEAKKVELIMNMSDPGKDLPVPDPYYGGQDGFEKVFDMLDRACEALIKRVTK